MSKRSSSQYSRSLHTPSLAKDSDQKFSNDNLFVLLATYEIINKKINDSKEKTIFDSYIIKEFNHKCEDDLFQQAYLQLRTFNQSYLLFKESYSTYNFSKDFNKLKIKDLLKSWGGYKSNEKFDLLIELLDKILDERHVIDLKTYQDIFVTNQKRNGKEELTKQIPMILSEINSDNGFSNFKIPFFKTLY